MSHPENLVPSCEDVPNTRASGWRRPLIVGSLGQVGRALSEALRAKHASAGGAFHLVETSRSAREGGVALDLATMRSSADAERLLDPIAPDLILCPGAMTFVDGCEEQPELAMQINASGPAVLAAYAHSRAIPFVFFSSDYVFAGTDAQPGPYTEEDPARPLNVYGASKLEGECSVLRAHPRALVIRTSWVYGPDPGGKNFITSLRRQLAAGQRVRVPGDQISTPTLNLDLAAMTLALLRVGATGVVHVTGPELMSRYELARAVARFFALDEGLIEGVETGSLGQRALRPLRSGLRSARIGGWTLPVSMRVLEAGLKASREQG